MGRRLAIIASIMLAGMVVAACGTSSSAPNDGPDAVGGALQGGWEAVFDIADDGTVPLDAALAAFSIAVGPLPDVTVPDTHAVESESGTPAVNAVLAHWDGLTADQQGAVTAYLDGAGEPSEAGIVPSGGFNGAADADEQAILGVIEQAKSNIAAQLGRDLTVDIELRIAPKLTGEAPAYMVGVDTAKGHFGVMAKCVIVVTAEGIPIMNEITGGVPSNRVVHLITHEVFHCFEADAVPPLAEFATRPNWVTEGLAEWAAANFSGTAGEYSWRSWLEVPTANLFTRMYSAIGFWAHLQEHGAFVWQTIDPVLAAKGSEAAYAVAIGAADATVLPTWGPGAYRDPTHAPEWDQDGPAILPYKYPAMTTQPTINAGDSWSVTVDRLEANTWDTDLGAEVAVVATSGPGMMLLADDTQLTFPGSETLCTIPGGCTCPDGSPGASAVFRVVSPGPARIGLTGDLSGTTLTILGQSLDAFCNESPPLDPCLFGTWSSTGYSATGQEVLTGTGVGITLIVDPSGEGFVDFAGHTPVIARVTEPTAPWVRVLQTGRGWLTLAPAGPGRAAIVGGVADEYSAKAQVDLGGGWMDAGPGISTSGGAVSPGSQLACESGGMVLHAPGDISRYRFTKSNTPETEIPPEPPDAEPIPGSGGSSSGTPDGPGETPPPPDWGLAYNACSLLTPDEIAKLGDPDSIPTAEDDLSSQFFHQCSIFGAATVQITPPSSPAAVKVQAEALDSQYEEVSGVDDWAVVVVDDGVLWISGGNALGTVSIFPWNHIDPDTPAFDTLVELLKAALSRL
ncbi:MAG: hypothetical protein R2823_09505 [Acidimicrobiia bacterium]